MLDLPFIIEPPGGRAVASSAYMAPTEAKSPLLKALTKAAFSFSMVALFAGGCALGKADRIWIFHLPPSRKYAAVHRPTNSRGAPLRLLPVRWNSPTPIPMSAPSGHT